MNETAFYNQFNPATPKILLAESFAVKAHAEQKYGSLPYKRHLEDVVVCLERFGFKARYAADSSLIEDLICAGWLHDVAEDTNASLDDIEALFGVQVRDIVSRVTDETAPTRSKRKELTYPKIRGHFGATVVKLADRIANVTASLVSSEAQFIKYADEQKKFQNGICVPMIAEPMWAHLRFLLEQKFGEKAQPLKSVRLFYDVRPDVKIEVKAFIEGNDLRIEDYAIGKRIESLFDGDSDCERILTVKSELKDSVLLALVQNRFHGNSALSDIGTWLSENGIPFESWSG